MDRAQCIQNRKSLTPLQRKQKEEAIVTQLLPFLKGNIGLYVPIQGEVDVFTPLLSYPNLYLPKVTGPESMKFCRYQGELKEGAYHVKEPAGQVCQPKDLDVIIVPMTGFCGFHRKGYGKGYYDRFLKQTKALKIGVAFDCQEMIFEKEEHDVDMDVLITETQCRRK